LCIARRKAQRQRIVDKRVGHPANALVIATNLRSELALKLQLARFHDQTAHSGQRRTFVVGEMFDSLKTLSMA